MDTSQSFSTQQTHQESLKSANWSNYILLLRPFTLIYPFLGVCSAALCAQNGILNGSQCSRILICGLGVSLLNAASNVLNQIADLNIDKINKAQRPLCSGRISIEQAKIVSITLYILSACLLGWVQLMGGRFSLLIALVVTICTVIYSYGPRTKKHWLASGITISLCRGILLTLIGWFCIESTLSLEPFLLGMVWSLFIFGAAATKDFSDTKGDAAFGCKTLPVKFGQHKAAIIIAPFLVFPFLLFNLFTYYSLLSGDECILHILGIGSLFWGMYIAYLIRRSSHSFSNTENHVSWKHMYVLMILGQTLQALAYYQF